MSNIVTLPSINLPAPLLQQFNNFNGADDLDAGVSGGFPVMSIRGAKWRIVEGGEEHPIYIPGSNDLAPAVRVVILRANAAVSKTFYAAQYVEGTDAKPDCASSNGVRPDPESANPQCDTCAACPQNVWGSKISPSGAKIKACADVRRVAILPSDDLNYAPILLRIPAASLADLAAYGKALKKRGIPYAAVVTKLSFDPDASYPKIMFTFERVLTAEEMQEVASRLDDPIIDDVLGLNAPVAALAAPAEDKFNIPQDIKPPAAAAEPAPQEAPKQTRRRAAPAQTAAPEPTAAPTPAPTAAPTQPAAQAGGDMLDDINAALASLQL